MENLKYAFAMLCRRKERATIAILAIATGIFTLILISAITLYFRGVSRGIENSFQGKLFICEKKNFWIGGGVFSEEKQSIINQNRGIKATIALLLTRVDKDELIVMGIPFMAVGCDHPELYLDANSILKGSNQIGRQEAVVGWDVATAKELQLGSKIKIRDRDFKVSGILKKNSSITDRQVVTQLSELQQTAHREGTLTAIIAIPKEGTQISNLQKEIKAKIPYLTLLTEKDTKKGMQEVKTFWDTLALIFLILSAISSILSISTVTAMSVTEREKEIAFKKAIGAENRHIFSEIVTESAIMSLIGWLLGYLICLIFITIMGSMKVTATASIFTITPILLLATFIWSLLLSIVATVIPLHRIVSMNIGETLRK